MSIGVCVEINLDFYTMQTIIRTAPASHFTQIDNSLLNSAMPAQAKNVLLYLLSKPDTWQVKAHDIRKQLGLSAYAVRKALRWLCSAGYAVWVRLKSGHTIWRIFGNPKVNPELTFASQKTSSSPAIPPQVEIPQVENQTVLKTLETEQINKPLPAAEAMPDNIVVVDPELIYPVQLTQVQRKAAKAVIKKVKQPELKQPVLFALAYAITSGSVKSPVAYLNGLVSRANNGTFEPIKPNSGAIIETAADRVAKSKRQREEAEKRGRINNSDYFAMLKAQYGDKVTL